MLKLYTKYERNRTIPGRVIDDLAIFFKGVNFHTLLLRGGSTKLHQIRDEQSFIIAAPNAKLWYQLVLRVEMTATQKRVVSKIEAIFHTF